MDPKFFPKLYYGFEWVPSLSVCELVDSYSSMHDSILQIFDEYAQCNLLGYPQYHEIASFLNGMAA